LGKRASANLSDTHSESEKTGQSAEMTLELADDHFASATRCLLNDMLALRASSTRTITSSGQQSAGTKKKTASLTAADHLILNAAANLAPSRLSTTPTRNNAAME